jgi:Asp-tRNA(Asn)/Glu-tRNA(Gln) amidotransferase A subunit family amidase
MSLTTANVRGNYRPGTPTVRTFHDARAAFLNGQDTPSDYLERCFATIDEREPQVQAWVTLNRDVATREAEAATKRYRAGQPLSCIDGMPVGIKDVIQTKDMPTTLGSPIFEGRHTHMDSASVNALRRAGASIVGKTVTTEFAFVQPGPTTNPFAPEATPGGSSSGSAAAVGAGMVPVALGNQVVGSVIRPAGYCANFAIKPTLGALHCGEGLSLSQLHLGVHAASLEDMWSVTHAIATNAGGDPGYPGLYGPATVAPASMPRSLVVLETEGWAQCDDLTRGAFDELLEQLAGQGVTLVRRADHGAVERFERASAASVVLCRIICSYEVRWAFRQYHETGKLSDAMSLWLEMAEALTPDDYRDALHRRAALRADMAALSHVGDAAVALSSPGPAPVLGQEVPSGESAYGFLTGSPACTAHTSLTGAPAISVPMLAINGLPVGAQLIGHAHDDWRLASYAAWLHSRVEPVVR